MKRLWIDVQGSIFDIWHIKSAEPEEEYNETRGGMQYSIILNKDATNSDVKDRVFIYFDKDERDDALFAIKEAISNSPGMYFVGETDGAIDDEEVKLPKGYVNQRKAHEDFTAGDDDEDDFDEDLDGHDFEKDID